MRLFLPGQMVEETTETGSNHFPTFSPVYDTFERKLALHTRSTQIAGHHWKWEEAVE